MGESKQLLAKWENLFMSGKVFLIVALAESLFLIGLQIYILSAGVDRCVRDPCRTETNNYYSISLFVMIAFFLYFAFNGIFTENMFEIFAFLITTTLLLIYSMILLSAKQQWYFVTQFSIVFSCELLYLYLGYKIYLEIGWYIYKRIGANAQMRQMFRVAQMFLTAVKVDLLFSLLLVILAGVYYLEPDNYEFYLTMLAFFLTFGWAYLGWSGVKKENTRSMQLYFAMAIVEPIYIIYKLVRLSSDDDLKDALPISLFAMAGITELIVRTGLLIAGYYAKRNFGKGLSDVLFQSGKHRSRPLSGAASASGGSQRGAAIL